MLGNRFIAGGDFNSKHVHWGSRLMLSRGRELLKAIQTLRLNAISSGHPTYWPSDRAKTPDLIDFCITKGFSENYIVCKPSLELNSDHTPVLVTLDSVLRRKPRKCTLHNNKTDLFHFRKLLNPHLIQI